MSLRIYGNRLIKSVPGQTTRPTLAKVREAVFNRWQGQILDCRWLDLCAGNGTMGAEALGRGAAIVVGIEQNGRAHAVIQQNWSQLAKSNQTFRLIRGHVCKRLPSLAGQAFDRIYFDPPYASDLYEPVLQKIADLRLLAPGGEMAVEHEPKRSLPATIVAVKGAEPQPAIKQDRTKVYGSSAITFYRWAESAKLNGLSLQ